MILLQYKQQAQIFTSFYLKDNSPKIKKSKLAFLDGWINNIYRYRALIPTTCYLPIKLGQVSFALFSENLI